MKQLGLILHLNLNFILFIETRIMKYFTGNRFLQVVALLHVFIITSTEGSSSDTYIGCYEDFGTEATFHKSTYPMSNFSIDQCKSECRNDKFSHAGIWGGSNCYCAEELKTDQVRVVDNALCNSPCSGNQLMSCGASDRNLTLLSVYSTCPRGMFGTYCSANCNCKENRNCSFYGLCPGSECALGWKLNRTNLNRQQCSIDIDECRTNASNCGQHQCINEKGSYYCDCLSGYELNYDRHSCIDVDECQTPCSSLNTTKCYECNQFGECQNTIGNYTCRCKDGFRANAQLDACEDIDECSQEMANCSDICTNTNGSYNCSCMNGFKLEDDGRRCVFVERQWWLIVGLGLGSGVLVTVIVALTITICKCLARRHCKNEISARHTGNKEKKGSSINLNMTKLGSKKCYKTVGQPNEADNIYSEIP